ncbi:MAG TPA: DUF5667 domain-containing protein [Candidatus Acidoferrum sp.]|nr:DUF5667 domain-containing protein [Candidatus Acidoferrum sp.]
MSHATTRDWLIPYADGMLAADERSRVDTHLAGCPRCAAELGQVRELNLLLVSLPPAPPVSFAPFWLKLQAVLPQRRALRLPNFARYRRLGVALAMATVAVLLAAGTALAAPSAMPDSPLYPVKQLEESLQLATTPASGRLAVEMDQAAERLREAQVMAANHKPLLAANSLRSFQVLVNDSAEALKHPADPRIAQSALSRLRAGLDAVEQENASKDDDESTVRDLVVSSVDELDRIENPDADTPTPTLVIGTQATPEPSAAPRPTPLKPTPSPERSDGERHH